MTPNSTLLFVMAGLVPAIHVFLFRASQDVDARDKPGHDEPDDAARNYRRAVSACSLAVQEISSV